MEEIDQYLRQNSSQKLYDNEDYDDNENYEYDEELDEEFDEEFDDEWRAGSGGMMVGVDETYEKRIVHKDFYNDFDDDCDDDNDE